MATVQPAQTAGTRLERLPLSCGKSRGCPALRSQPSESSRGITGGLSQLAHNTSSHSTQARLQPDSPGLPVPRDARLEDGSLAFLAAHSYSIRPFLSKGQL